MFRHPDPRLDCSSWCFRKWLLLSRLCDGDYLLFDSFFTYPKKVMALYLERISCGRTTQTQNTLSSTKLLDVFFNFLFSRFSRFNLFLFSLFSLQKPLICKSRPLNSPNSLNSDPDKFSEVSGQICRKIFSFTPLALFQFELTTFCIFFYFFCTNVKLSYIYLSRTPFKKHIYGQKLK